jgi:hypothetical protein
MGNGGMDSSGSEYEPVAGSYENDNKTSVSIIYIYAYE